MAAFSAADPAGRFIHYGVREHGMAAAMNGIALHGGVIPYSGTFLVFSDYCRPAIRLAALMGIRVIHVLTHDSIGLGEDGPTHQPVEHLAALRAMPNLLVFRPCDAVETAECWELALAARTSPSVLALTRQNVPQLRTDDAAENRCAAGAYEFVPAENATRAGIAVRHRLRSRDRGRSAQASGGAQCRGPRRVGAVLRAVARLPAAARAAIIGDAPVRVGVEAAIRQGWDAIIGSDGAFVGMTGFGASAPAADLYRHFGITPERVAERHLACASLAALRRKLRLPGEGGPQPAALGSLIATRCRPTLGAASSAGQGRQARRMAPAAGSVYKTWMADQLLFDKLAYIDRLKRAGIDEGQARAHAEAVEEALRESVATKHDVAAVE